MLYSFWPNNKIMQNCFTILSPVLALQLKNKNLYYSRLSRRWFVDLVSIAEAPLKMIVSTRLCAKNRSIGTALFLDFRLFLPLILIVRHKKYDGTNKKCIYQHKSTLYLKIKLQAIKLFRPSCISHIRRPGATQI